MLVQMHQGKPINQDLQARYGLALAELICFTEGWCLTYRGRQLVRHLTGQR